MVWACGRKADTDVGAFIGWLLLLSWATMIWAAVRLVKDLRGAVRDWRNFRHVRHQHALR